MASKCPCCGALDIDTSHARMCPRTGAQVDMHQVVVHAMSGISKRFGLPHQVESGEPFTADRNLRMDIVFRRGAFRDAPSLEYRNKGILLDVTHADP